MRFAPAAVLLLLVFSCQTDRDKPDSLPPSLDSLFTLHPGFSGVVLVAEKGKPVYHRAFGYRVNEHELLNDTTTIFELASVSKQFTAMVIMMLKEDGKLGYDDPMEKYVAGLSYPGITIRHLLTHTSGLPDYQALMDEQWDKSKVAGNPEIIAYLKQFQPPPRFAPGEGYEYSNTGYVLLASIAEAASGQDFIALCRERIFGPLGMTSTDIRTLQQKSEVENFAKGYVYVKQEGRYVAADSFPSSNYIVWLGDRKGPGRVSSSSTDLLRWDRALYDSALVKPQTLREAFMPCKLLNDSLSHYGFGWELDKHPTLGRKIWHTGSNPGYSTRIVRFVDTDKTVVVLSNNAYPGITELDKGLDYVLGIRVPTGKQPGPPL